MPLEPPPTTWSLSRPLGDHPHDVWARGADLEPGTLLAGYRLGLFPMPVDGDIVWWSPPRRAVIEVGGFVASRSLRRAARGYVVRVDTAFETVIRECADPRRPHGWIDESFVEAYTRLHALGWAHSIEAWDDEGLAGGLYGVAIGGLFAAESMFYRRRNASKAALLGLIELLREATDFSQSPELRPPPGRLIDAQWQTPHLASLGAREITRAEYHRRLDAVLTLPPVW